MSAKTFDLSPASVEMRDIYDNSDNLIIVAEDKKWNLGVFTLLVSEFNNDSEHRFSKIYNNSDFSVGLDIAFSVDNPNVFDRVKFSLPSNLADNADDVRKLSEVLKDMADAQEYFSAVLESEFLT